MDLVDVLFRQGLGELPVFHSRLNSVYLGNMVYERGRIFFKDKGMLIGIQEVSEVPDWNSHIVGTVCYRKLLKWESLSFYGIDYCELQSAPDPGFVVRLKGIQNQYGDRLFDFIGSIYRAYHLMLDNGLLPVVLLRPVKIKGNEPGLMIADLKSTPTGKQMGDEIERAIRHAIERHLTLNVEEITEENPS